MAYTEAEMDKMLADARATLKKIPGVEGVGFGYRQKAGEITSTLCWRVYVTEKKSKDSLPPEELIPAMFADFPTDVIKVPTIQRIAECHDLHKYSPLVSGATVCNMVPNATGGFAAGTLGFFATINGNPDPKENVVFVTNHHVVAENIATAAEIANKEIFQPVREIVNGVASIVTYEQSSAQNAQRVPEHESIGRVLNVGIETNHPFTYEGTTNPPGHPGWFVDASSVKMDLSISSWCDSHCGTKFKPEVQALGLVGGNQIANIARVTPAMLTALPVGTFYNVVKYGGRTKRTEGKVIDCTGSFATHENVICIVATANNCRGDRMFADEGDSGSALINANRELIGLVYGITTLEVGGVMTPVTVASHIHPVLNYLAVTPITTAAPHAYMSTKADGPGSITGDKLFALKGKLATTSLGAQILGLFDTHRTELVELVNHCRPVTVAWRRHQGPGFTNRIMANSRNPEVLIPAQIEGISLRQLCDAMLPQLLAHGSPALRADLDAWASRILPHTDGLESLHALVDQLSPENA